MTPLTRGTTIFLGTSIHADFGNILRRRIHFSESFRVGRLRTFVASAKQRQCDETPPKMPSLPSAATQAGARVPAKRASIRASGPCMFHPHRRQPPSDWSWAHIPAAVSERLAPAQAKHAWAESPQRRAFGQPTCTILGCHCRQ
jgi:hypothetical protein